MKNVDRIVESGNDHVQVTVAIHVVEHYRSDVVRSGVAHASLKRRLEEPSLRDVFFGALQAMGKLSPASEGETEKERFEARARAVHALYKDEHHHRDWIDVCERLTEFDELVVSWRLRHIQLVERIIGIRMGTGGSAGSSYLKLTLDKKFFPELWEARTLLTE